MSGPQPRDAERIEARPGTAEWCYRRLLRAYPPAYRAAHGEEIVGTLLEVSAGRGRPSVRESAGLVRGGLAARLREHTAQPTPWWADGLALGAFLIALSNLAADLSNFEGGVLGTGWVVCSLVLVAALMRGRLRMATAVALVVVLIQAFWAGYLLIVDAPADHAFFGVMYGSVLPATGYAVMAAALIVLVVRRPPRPQSRSWWWLAALAVMSVWSLLRIPAGFLAETIRALGGGSLAEWATTYAPTSAAVYVALTMLLLSCGIWAAAVTRDLRWPLGAALFLLANVGPYVTAVALGSAALVATLWGAQALLVGAMVVTARRGVRARA